MAGPDDIQGLTIGALSKLTGVPVETLRTWERRYGFPNPERDEQGHRVYAAALVEHVRLVERAILAGTRASAAVKADINELRDRFGHADQPLTVEVADDVHAQVQPWLQATQVFDGEVFENLLARDWNRLGAMAFLKERVGPYLEELGVAWMERRLDVAHEHFGSERLRDFLTAHWRPLSDRSRGPRVLCATLPGESHVLGLQMAATALALGGCRVVMLGADTPVAQIANAARSQTTAAVVVSVSVAAHRSMAHRDIVALREALPRDIRVVLGGQGAPEGVEGTVVFNSLDALLEWGQNLEAELSPIH